LKDKGSRQKRFVGDMKYFSAVSLNALQKTTFGLKTKTYKIAHKTHGPLVNIGKFN